MGAPGSGKTTYLAYLSNKARKRGQAVYSNVYIQNNYIIDIQKDLNTYLIEGALIVIDEGGDEFDSRHWKSFSKKLTRWFQMHRHYTCDVIISCQNHEDIDAKIKRLIQKIEVCKPCFIPFVNKVKKIAISIDIKEDGTEIIKKYTWLPFFMNRYYIAPLVYKLFNSYYQDKLKPHEAKEWLTWSKENENAFVNDYTLD